VLAPVSALCDHRAASTKLDVSSFLVFRMMSARLLQILTATCKDFQNQSMTTSRFLSGALIDRLRRREPETLTHLIHEHAGTLFRAARGMGFSQDEAEDLAQEVFTTFLETLDRFEGRSQVRTWLFGILHNKIHERRREQLRDERSEPLDELIESRFDTDGHWNRPPADLDRLLQSKEIESAIQDCLGKLPAMQKEVFVLREVEELDMAETCKILDKTVTHISVLLHRARVRLRECLEAKGWRKES